MGPATCGAAKVQEVPGTGGQVDHHGDATQMTMCRITNTKATPRTSCVYSITRITHTHTFPLRVQHTRRASHECSLQQTMSDVDKQPTTHVTDSQLR